jgi:hypothetical protein
MSTKDITLTHDEQDHKSVSTSSNPEQQQNEEQALVQKNKGPSYFNVIFR